MRIGAHTSIIGGYTSALQSIHDKGGNCMQIFSSSPRIWKRAIVTDTQIKEFKETKKKLDIDPVYFHASYLINLANPDRGGYASVSALTEELTLAHRMDIRGSIIHLGSLANGTYKQLITNIEKILDSTPDDVQFIAENAGTRKIGTNLDELGNILRDVSSKRIKICLDTCHLHAAGYDLSTEKSFELFFAEFDKKIGLEKLEVIHVNDSRDSFGTNRDRHENLGEGEISPEVFKLLINHHLTKDIPFILEVPGFDKKGPDKKNIDIFKSFLLNY